MAYVRRLPSGRWQATVRLPSGRRTTRSDPLRGVVVGWARRVEDEAARGVWRDPRAGRVGYELWRDRWLAARVVERSTRRLEASLLRNHLDGQWSGWQLGAITRMDVQSWVRRMEQSGVGRTAIARAYGLLRGMLADAVLEELIPANPCRRVDLPATPPRQPAWYTREQIDAICARLPERHRIATELAVWTGLRWGEFAGLRAGDVDWLRRRVRVVGVVDQNGRWKPYPKTSRSRREVPVPEHVLDLLSPLAAGAGPDRWLFTTRSGRSWSGRNWRRVWRRAVLAAGAPAHGPHTLRHTAASWLAQSGVSLADIRRLLGHESTATTDRYSHLAPDVHSNITESWARQVAAWRRAQQ